MDLYEVACGDAFRLLAPNGFLEPLPLDHFFTVVLWPFYATHEAIGPGNVTPGKPNLFGYFKFFDIFEQRMKDAKRKSNPEYELPEHFQHFANYRLLLENLREMAPPISIRDFHQTFHKDLATLELLWLYTAISLYYHSSDPKPIDQNGRPAKISEKPASESFQLTKMQTNFDLLLSFEKSLRKLLCEVYGDLPAARSENGQLVGSLLKKVFEHISSDDWKHFPVTPSVSGSLREDLISSCLYAKDWIGSVPNMSLPRNIADWKDKLATPREVDADATRMILTLRKLLGKVINPMVQNGASQQDQRNLGATSDNERERSTKFISFKHGYLTSFFAPKPEILGEAIEIIDGCLSRSIRSTLSGESFPHNFASAVQDFNNHVAILESLSHDVIDLLPVSGISYLEVAFDGPKYFDRFDDVSNLDVKLHFELLSTRGSLVVPPGIHDPNDFAETVTETTQLSQGIGNIANINGASTSSFAGQPHSQHLPIPGTDPGVLGTTSHPAARQSFSNLMDHFRYP
ncbi:hypothetical protein CAUPRSCDRAFT_12152 [Caulochytrium protostelioides]|uniref:Uncharacterized protein n=1 Tax=Caulochytrium protostelioides TaxID=1555241 RepID=A0A4P9WXH4_9FUNG|nr:hypothetical protein CAUPRSCDRAFT_12152 [Caulochytrium protostelioides]